MKFHLGIIFFAVLFSAPVFAEHSSGEDREKPDFFENLVRAAVGKGQQGGGVQNQKSPNRSKADESKKLGEKAVEQLAKSGEKFSEAIEKSTQAVNNMFNSFKPTDNDSESVKNIEAQVAKIREVSNQPIVSKDAIKAIDETVKLTTDLQVKSMQEQAMLSQTVFRPKEVPIQESVGKKLEKYFLRAQGSNSPNGLVNSTQLTAPQAQTPQVHGGY